MYVRWDLNEGSIITGHPETAGKFTNKLGMKQTVKLAKRIDCFISTLAVKHRQTKTEMHPKWHLHCITTRKQTKNEGFFPQEKRDIKKKCVCNALLACFPSQKKILSLSQCQSDDTESKWQFGLPRFLIFGGEGLQTNLKNPRRAENGGENQCFLFCLFEDNLWYPGEILARFTAPTMTPKIQIGKIIETRIKHEAAN